jgi:hypothetical protein
MKIFIATITLNKNQFLDSFYFFVTQFHFLRVDYK